MQGTPFDCQLCTKVAQDIRCCTSCGSLYCQNCLREIFGASPECLKCGNKQFTGLEKTPLEDAYKMTLSQSLIVEQKADVPKAMKIPLQPQLPASPPLPLIKKSSTPCVNFELCFGTVASNFQIEQVCSPECLLFTMIEPLVTRPENGKIDSSVFLNQVRQVEKYLITKRNPITANNQSRMGATIFQFEVGTLFRCEKNQIMAGDFFAGFRSLTTRDPYQGVLYWEVIPLQSNKKELKIGVSTTKQVGDQAFSDSSQGYAYHTVGKFVSGTIAETYGISFVTKGEVGVLVDTTRGILGFSFNGKYLGHALKGEKLLKGPIYPAVAMGSGDGIEYRVSVPIPPQVLVEFLK